MVKTSIKERLATRQEKVILSKLSTKTGWYFIRLTRSNCVISQTDDADLNYIIKKEFGINPPVINPLIIKDVYLLTPSVEPVNNTPICFVKRKACYDVGLILFLMKPDSLDNAHPIPFSAAIPAIESLHFAKGAIPDIIIQNLQS